MGRAGSRGCHGCTTIAALADRKKAVEYMRRRALWAGIALIIALALSLSRGGFSVSAQSGGGYDLTWNTIDTGGGASVDGEYTLRGTIGQHDAAVVSGGAYTLGGGFWGGSSKSQQAHILLPLVQR